MKAMIFLRWREGLSREAFAEWWLNRHRPLAERLPGLLRHSLNLLPEGAPFDAVVEQWFASAEAAETCYNSPEGEAVVRDSAGHVASRVRMMVEEHDFQPGAPLDIAAALTKK